jgi:hypothetical protein
MVGEAKEKMKIKLSQGKKIFIACAIVTVVVLSAISLFLSYREVEEFAEAQASPGVIRNVNIQIGNGNNYQVGGKYSIFWDSDCRGGNAMVWLSSASSSKANIGILVPITKFTATDFGADGVDARAYFADIWKINSSQTANKGKLSFVVPPYLYINGSAFKNDDAIYYLFNLADGRTALQKMVKDQARMSLMPETYYLRVDIKGKNSCTAIGYSQPINVK